MGSARPQYALPSMISAYSLHSQFLYYKRSWWHILVSEKFINGVVLTINFFRGDIEPLLHFYLDYLTSPDKVFYLHLSKLDGGGSFPVSFGC